MHSGESSRRYNSMRKASVASYFCLGNRGNQWCIVQIPSPKDNQADRGTGMLQTCNSHLESFPNRLFHTCAMMN